jgi:hypothetical protein
VEKKHLSNLHTYLEPGLWGAKQTFLEEDDVAKKDTKTSKLDQGQNGQGNLDCDPKA